MLHNRCRISASRTLIRTGGLILLCMVFGAHRCAAQPLPGSAVPVPRLFTIAPSGGKAGTTVEITWTGADTEEPQGFYFSHPGFKAEPIIPPPLPPDPKKPAPKQTTPQPVNKFRVTIPSDLAPGVYDIRLVNKWGISNPRAFAVGDLPEVAEKEPNDDVPQAQRVAINTVINGINGSTPFTGGEGAASGQEVLITVDFTTPVDLAADHYFFRPEVQLTNGNFLWLSAGGPPLFTGDLQTWIRNDNLAPDWLRVGTDITHQGPFNAAFSLTGQTVVPEPGSLALLGSGLVALVLLRRRSA